MNKLIFTIITAICLMPLQGHAYETEIKCSFNSNKVILPSSQFTPETPYEALVWVFKGATYQDSDYNKILAAPSNDKSDNEWYSFLYNPEEETTGVWSMQTAPFSSDEYYMGQQSYRWTTSDIMGEMYMRRSFILDEPDLLSGGVYLACGHDDAPSEWYINGVLVHSVSDGWDNEEYILLSEEHKNLLKTDGSINLLAVHVHQNWGGAFADCGLYAADMSIVRSYLSTVADGAWPCSYYLLNYNSDFIDAENEIWFDLNEDECDWMQGYGPFSNDNNMFFTTEWASQVRPILIRRHFSIDTEKLAETKESELTLTCSYDEDPIVYLNGTKIWEASGWNDNNYARFVLTDEQKELLKSGDNVLAVSLRQGNGGGHIDYGLFIESSYNPGDTSEVNDLTDTVNSDKRIFNLNGNYMGTSLDRLHPGIYIRNGKKILITKQ